MVMPYTFKYTRVYVVHDPETSDWVRDGWMDPLSGEERGSMKVVYLGLGWAADIVKELMAGDYNSWTTDYYGRRLKIKMLLHPVKDGDMEETHIFEGDGVNDIHMLSRALRVDFEDEEEDYGVDNYD